VKNRSGEGQMGLAFRIFSRFSHCKIFQHSSSGHTFCTNPVTSQILLAKFQYRCGVHHHITESCASFFRGSSS